MNRVCNICNIEIDENNYLKDRNACKNCYNKNRRKNNHNTLIQNHQPRIENVNNNKNIINNPSVSTYENTACVVIGPRNTVKLTIC